MPKDVPTLVVLNKMDLAEPGGELIDARRDRSKCPHR